MSINRLGDDRVSAHIPVPCAAIPTLDPGRVVQRVGDPTSPKDETPDVLTRWTSRLDRPFDSWDFF